MRLLIVSPHFPPVNAPDMHRVRTALPTLLERGWRVTILAVDPAEVSAPRDEQLAAALPPGIRIVRCGAWPLRLTRRLGLRTLAWRAWSALDRAGAAIIREETPDLIFFSTTQFLVTTLGPRWRRRFGVPYVIDLQDPWLTDYYESPGAPRPPGGWKYRIARFIAKKLEPRAFREAAGFVSVSPAYFDALTKRYAWFENKPRITLPFGVDPAEYAAIPSSIAPAFTSDPGQLHLASVGAIGPIMAVALRALFAQLQSLRTQSPELAAKLRLHFIGTSYASGGQAKPSVEPIAREFAVADLVSEQTDRVPWRVAQATMQAAAGLLVLTSEESAYTPSKLAGCFLAGRPLLVVTGPSSGAAHLTAELGLGLRLDPHGGTPTALIDFIRLVQGPPAAWLALRQAEVFHQTHTAAARSRALASFLQGLVRPSP